MECTAHQGILPHKGKSNSVKTVGLAVIGVHVHIDAHTEFDCETEHAQRGHKGRREERRRGVY